MPKAQTACPNKGSCISSTKAVDGRDQVHKRKVTPAVAGLSIETEAQTYPVSLVEQRDLLGKLWLGDNEPRGSSGNYASQSGPNEGGCVWLRT